MATTNTPRPWRALGIALAVVVALYAAVFLGFKQHTPQLGLDLRGGTSVTLTPRSPNHKAPSGGQLSKAVDIIRQRVNGLGVAEADVTTEGSNVVVSVPGKGRSDVVNLVGRTAELRFRQVLQEEAAGTTVVPTPSGTPVPSASAQPSGSTSAAPSPATTGSPSPTTTSNGRVVPPALAATPTPTTPPATRTAAATGTPAPTPTAPASIDPLQQQFNTIDCQKLLQRTTGSLDDPNKPLVTCSRDASTKYLLAKAEVLGKDVKSASATIDTQGSSQWMVLLNFNSKGAKQFGTLTTRVQPLPAPTNQVAIVLDGVVQSAPQIINPITNGQAQITGNFSQHDATDLANVLKYGALPLTFDISTSDTISPTLGSDQLRAGLLAGIIGLGLVILYSLLYYRGLGLVTIASLLVSGLTLFAATTLLGHLVGYTLSLAGIAGFIVAVGITADSFVVFFERLRDEVREGRTMRSGVERAWVRARRTIISADMVSLLAAVVLYLVSVGNVRGFAFTLGLSTISDLFIVFFFTKPLVTVLARTRLYGGGTAFSGLSPGRLGVIAPARRPVPTGKGA